MSESFGTNSLTKTRPDSSFGRKSARRQGLVGLLRPSKQYGSRGNWALFYVTRPLLALRSLTNFHLVRISSNFKTDVSKASAVNWEHFPAIFKKFHSTDCDNSWEEDLQKVGSETFNFSARRIISCQMRLHGWKITTGGSSIILEDPCPAEVVRPFVTMRCLEFHS